MNTPANEPSPETDRKPDPREVLNDLRQRVVVALLSLGFSRRTAARHVGISHTSIARAAARDPHFAKQLSDAESVADFSALRMVRDAARQEKYWRAAAWLLERRLPDEFGHRAPHSFSGDQVMAMLAGVFSYTLPALKEEQKEQFMRSFNGTLGEVEAAVKHADRWHNMAADDAGADDGARCARPTSIPNGMTPRARRDRPRRQRRERRSQRRERRSSATPTPRLRAVIVPRPPCKTMSRRLKPVLRARRCRLRPVLRSRPPARRRRRNCRPETVSRRLPSRMCANLPKGGISGRRNSCVATCWLPMVYGNPADLCQRPKNAKAANITAVARRTPATAVHRIDSVRRVGKPKRCRASVVRF